MKLFYAPSDLPCNEVAVSRPVIAIFFEAERTGQLPFSMNAPDFGPGANFWRFMMTFMTMAKSTAIAGTFGLGVLIATASGAAAHYTTTRCDSDGDRCWTVRCDDDGDDCRRISSYDNNRGYNRYNYGSRYRYGNGNAYGYRGDGNSRCDRDGDDCHPSRDYNYDRDYNREGY